MLKVNRNANKSFHDNLLDFSYMFPSCDFDKEKDLAVAEQVSDVVPISAMLEQGFVPSNSVETEFAEFSHEYPTVRPQDVFEATELMKTVSRSASSRKAAESAAQAAAQEQTKTPSGE